jgi:hypothetical protein
MWSHLLVVVAETASPESEALDLVPAITNAILEEQQIIVKAFLWILLYNNNNLFQSIYFSDSGRCDSRPRPNSCK